MKASILCLLLASVAASLLAEKPVVIEADVCVYGGTSGGVAAAVQAARMGKSVVIAEPGAHLGGMTSGGLSAVDIGDPRSVGGIAREYFTKLAATVGTTLAWDKPFESKGGGPATGGAYAIEPHKAEQVFNSMAKEAGVKIHLRARLAKVIKDGARIREFVTEDGAIFRARMFIDTTYEGDLMAAAGVSYTLMREGNAKYGETYNGIHYNEKYVPRTGHLPPGETGRVKGGQGVWDRDWPLDPYIVKGDPKSGLLPLIQEGAPGTPGEPAPGVQAYCFRLCLSRDPANSIPIAPPPDYDPKRYEIVVRFIEACLANGDDMDLRWFSKHDALPNQKWDFNTATFGGNLPGASWEWPEATYARREQIAKDHENYHRGLLHFLATDSRVPEEVRQDMRRYGLPKDEFQDSGGWPHQLYIREARRMVSSLVLTEHHTFGRKVAPKSVGLGSYGTDTHEIRRIAKDGVVIREGKTSGGRDNFGPYQIGYDAIVPKPDECENLFVTFALSASHTAFSSIRMEPVFMVTSQSAATAACLAIDDKASVQKVDYAKLRSRLLKDGQVLDGDKPKDSAAVSRPLPMVDLSSDTARQVIIAQGTEEIYQGHPTTVLLPDGKTMFAVWTLGHGGFCGPMKRSADGGRTWSELLPVPENWKETKNCPSLYRLTDPKGVTRLFVFAGQGPRGKMHSSHSLDDGKTWTPMKSLDLDCVMPFCTIMPVDGGRRLIGLTNIRRPGETKDPKSNVVAQSESTDGGLTWAPFRILVDLGDLKPCEPEVIRSPDGKQLLCLIRENTRSQPAHYITSDDEGRNWTPVKDLPFGLHGDRHKAVYLPDGRLVVCFREMGLGSPTRGHFVAWVGRYEDILAGRDGEYRIKLLHNHAGTDCGYPGLELLPDGTLVATTYVKYRPGAEKHSVVSVRFTLAETDKAEKTIPKLEPAKVKVAGLLLDDRQAKFTGKWVESSRQQPLVGGVYRHDDKSSNKTMTAVFKPKIAEAGRYEVRLLYVATSNRATNVPVTVLSKDGQQVVMVNQKVECLEDGVPRALGTFAFEAGAKGSITIANKDADGYVVVDGLQVVPEAIALAERATRSGSGFPVKGKPSQSHLDLQKVEAQRKAQAAAVAFSPLTEEVANATTPKPDTEPVFLAKGAKAGAVDHKSYDLVVVGATAGGVACAVRAAREGCTVLLVQHNRHIGGMLSNGLMQWDALYGGPRAPIFSELLRNIEKHYIETFGKDSKNHQIVRYTHEHYPIGWVEPHVMERECHRLVAGEKNITLLLGHYPTALEREGALLKSVTLRAYGTTKDIRVKATTFADGTYEGDLFALAKVPYRAGREARDEYNEPHAGKIFVNIDHGTPQSVIDQGLNIRAYNSRQGSVDPTSPFTADNAIQAFNYRFCVTKDPANRLMLTEPPPGYNREEYVNYDRKSIATNGGPNMKSHMNSPILPGENHAYPEASWEEREKIIDRHRNFGLGLIWFLQNDDSISAKKKEEYRQWGLPKDEFQDNGHIPYEMYVRETRRIVGRHVITEHDGMLAKDYARTLVHPDSIAITDWYMDSHSCTLDSRPGFRYEGKLILTEESRPAQIPYRSLLPQGVDNLLVPVCLSSTHIAWGAIRLEPVWMQTGEAAGFAAALAKKENVTPAKLNPELLLHALVERRQLVSFFNDLKVDADDPRIPAAQYFATKGFFHDYNARLDEPVKESTLAVWTKAAQDLKAGQLDGPKVAAAVAKSEAGPSGKPGKKRGNLLQELFEKK